MPKGDTLSPKQEGFVRDYLETGNATEAAARNYDIGDRTVAGAIGGENLKKPSIIEKLKAYSDQASDNIITLSNKARSEAVRLNANKDILDRAGYKPVERSEQKIKLEETPSTPETDELSKEYEEKLKQSIIDSIEKGKVV